MPKSVLKIDSFEGGINSNTDAKDLEPNQVADAQDAYFGKKGQVANIGIAKGLNQASISVGVTAGYGLKDFKTNYNFGTPASGTYWGSPTLVSGHNGHNPKFVLNICYDAIYDGHPTSCSDGGSMPNEALSQPKYICENWGLRIHIGSTVGTPDISFPLSDDDGTATVRGDNISYRIIDDGTNKWFGLFPQNVLYNHVDGDGVEYTVDYDYFFTYGSNGRIMFNNNAGGGTTPLAAGYTTSGTYNIIKALAGMVAKDPNIIIDMTPYPAPVCVVYLDAEQYDDFTPTNKYMWVEYRGYANPDSVNQVSGDASSIIKPITHVGEVVTHLGGNNYSYEFWNEDYNFLDTPQIFDSEHSAYGNSSRQIMNDLDGNNAVLNLCSEGYKGSTGIKIYTGDADMTEPWDHGDSHLQRRLLEGTDAVATSCVISLVNTAGTDATASGETYKIKITGANTPTTGTEVSQAYHASDFDTFTEVTAALATAITGVYGGSELVTNGDMDTASDWTAGTGWAVNSGSSGVAQCSSGTGAANALTNHGDHLLSLSTDTYYKVQLDVTRTSGTLWIDLGDTNGTNKQSTSLSGSNQVFIIKTPGTLVGQLVRFYGGHFRGSIDNVSVKQLTAGIGGLTASSSGAQLTISTTGVGQHTAYSFEPSISRTTDILLKNEITEGLLLIDSNSDMYVKDLSLEYWFDKFNHSSASSTQLYWQDTGAKPQFYSDGGVLRFSDNDFSHTNNDPAWFGHINKDNLFNQGGTTNPYDIKGWFVKDQAKVFPDDPSDWLVDDDWSDSLTTPSSKLDIKISRNTGDGDGTWTGEKLKFHLTALFDDDSETLPVYDTDYLTFKDNLGNRYLDLDPGDKVEFACTVDPASGSTFSFDERMKGFRIYFTKESDGYGVFYELGTINFKDGFVRADGEGTTAWTALGSTESDAQIATVTFQNEYLGTRYEDNTTYSSQNRLNHVKWKASTIVRNRCWVGNVQYKNESGVLEHYPNKLFASPVFKMDTFLAPDGIRDYGVLEGDEIVKLENLADRVLMFTQNNLLIINVATLNDEFLEESHKWKGVSSPNHVISSSQDVVWANEYSVYRYNGENVEDLMMNTEGDFEGNRNISRKVWGEFFNDNSLVMYDPSKNQVIIKRSTVGSSAKNNGDVYIYDLDTESWAFGKNRFVSTSDVNTPKDTNAVTTKDGSLYIINGRDIYFNDQVNHGEIDEGGATVL